MRAGIGVKAVLSSRFGKGIGFDPDDLVNTQSLRSNVCPVWACRAIIEGSFGPVKSSRPKGGAQVPQAVVDPEELRNFMRNLRTFNRDLRERLSSLNQQMQALAVTWRDQEQKKFAAEFEAQARNLARLIETNDEHIRYLSRKADQIDEYLQS